MKHALTEVELKALDGVPVEVHYKLNNPHQFWFCIKRRPQQTIYGYAQRLVLENCTMRINHTARRKVADGANRSVHAWIRGTFRYRETSAENCHDEAGAWSENEIHYHPKRDQSFVLHNGGVIETAKTILFWRRKIYLLKGV